jgi:molecular chaperone GrpE
MSQRVSIPVRIVRPKEGASEGGGTESHRVSTRQPANPETNPVTSHPLDGEPITGDARDDQAIPSHMPDPEIDASERDDQVQAWRDRALRLQADMDNYRKRQQRLAQAEIQSERERLLGTFLEIVDDLERALAAHDAAGAASPSDHQGTANRGIKTGPPSRADLYRGVELTHRSALHLLQKEGVQRIQAENRPFDPNWHEAVTSVPRNGHQVDPGTVIQVLQAGYRLGDRLLRPAKVVVAI